MGKFNGLSTRRHQHNWYKKLRNHGALICVGIASNCYRRPFIQDYNLPKGRGLAHQRGDSEDGSGASPCLWCPGGGADEEGADEGGGSLEGSNSRVRSPTHRKRPSTLGVSVTEGRGRRGEGVGWAIESGGKGDKSSCGCVRCA